MSLYSATKQSIEQITSYYSHYYKIPSIGLRFFTCYGPWKPDLSVTKITNDMIKKKKLFFSIMVKQNEITHIDDTVDGIIKCLNLKIKNQHEIFNLGTAKLTALYS